MAQTMKGITRSYVILKGWTVALSMSIGADIKDEGSMDKAK
jgi:hypothetical protein